MKQQGLSQMKITTYSILLALSLMGCSGKINNTNNWIPCMNKHCKKPSTSPKRIEGNVKVCSSFATVAEALAKKRDLSINIRETREYEEFSKIQYRGMNIGEELTIAVEQTPFMKPTTLSAAITYSCSVSGKSVAAHEMNRRFSFYKSCNKYNDSYGQSLICIKQADKDRLFN